MNVLPKWKGLYIFWLPDLDYCLSEQKTASALALLRKEAPDIMLSSSLGLILRTIPFIIIDLPTTNGDGQRGSVGRL
jgi:hypothetical protein